MSMLSDQNRFPAYLRIFISKMSVTKRLTMAMPRQGLECSTPEKEMTESWSAKISYIPNPHTAFMFIVSYKKI